MKNIVFFLVTIVVLFQLNFKQVFGGENGVELVNIDKHVTKHYAYQNKLPILVLSIKNNTQKDVTESMLHCEVSFIDIDNKRIICEYNRNLSNVFKSLKPGYTSPRLDISILTVKEQIVSLIGQKPINFNIQVKVTLKLLNTTDVVYDTVFKPEEYSQLPLWE